MTKCRRTPRHIYRSSPSQNPPAPISHVRQLNLRPKTLKQKNIQDEHIEAIQHCQDPDIFTAFKIPKCEDIQRNRNETELFVWIVEVPEYCSEKFFLFIKALRKVFSLKNSPSTCHPLDTHLSHLEADVLQSPLLNEPKEQHSTDTNNKGCVQDGLKHQESARVNTPHALETPVPKLVTSHYLPKKKEQVLPGKVQDYIELLQGDPQLALFLQKVRQKRLQNQRKIIEKFPEALVKQSFPSYFPDHLSLQKHHPHDPPMALTTPSLISSQFKDSPYSNYSSSSTFSNLSRLNNSKGIQDSTFNNSNVPPLDDPSTLLMDLAEVYLLLLGQALRLAASSVSPRNFDISSDSNHFSEFLCYDRHISRRLSQFSLDISSFFDSSTTSSAHNHDAENTCTDTSNVS